MKKIIPSLKEPLYVTVSKIAVIITTTMATLAIAILLPADGHPPGILFIPMVLIIWLASIAAIVLMRYTLKLLASNSSTNKQYTVTILISNVLFLYILLNTFYTMMPFSVYVGMPFAFYVYPGVSIDKILVSIFSYLVLAGTVSHKNWARFLTVILLSLPIFLFLYRLFSAGVSFGEFNIKIIFLLMAFSIFVWIIYDYLRNKKIAEYFSN